MRKIMVGVDDLRVNRLIMTEAARIADIEIALAEDGKQAFTTILGLVASNNAPKLIITDIHMPDGNGIELIARLKETDETKYIPILVLSTEKDFQTKIRSKQLGAAGWLAKPLTPEEIAGVIKKFVP